MIPALIISAVVTAPRRRDPMRYPG